MAAKARLGAFASPLRAIKKFLYKDHVFVFATAVVPGRQSGYLFVLGRCKETEADWIVAGGDERVEHTDAQKLPRVVLQQAEGSAGIAFTAMGRANQDADLRPAVHGRKVGEVDEPDRLLAVRNHQPQFARLERIGGLASQILPQGKAREMCARSTDAPRALIVLHFIEQVEVFGFKGTEGNHGDRGKGLFFSNFIHPRSRDEHVFAGMVDADMGVVAALVESIEDFAIVEILGIVNDVCIDIVDAKSREEFIGQQFRTDMLRGFYVEQIQPPAFRHLFHGFAVATHVDELVLLVSLDGEQVFVEGFGLLVDEAEHGLEVDGHADGDGRTEIVRVEMLLEEDEHSVVKDVHVAKRVLVRALALVVQDGIGHVVVLVAILLQAIGEVNVFAVHEIVFVKASRLVERTVARQEKCPRDDVYLHGLFLVQIAHVVLAKRAALGEEVAQARHLAHSHPRRGQAAARFKGERTVGA